jgi:hypothetical protein
MPCLENRKLEWFFKQRGDDDDSVSNSICETCTSHRKLFLRSRFQNMVADEISALQNNLLQA